jgi:hypothetical protein
MAYYSGQFHQQGFGWTEREASRVFYLDETDTFKLAYCNSETAWTISFKSASSTCEYLFKSEDTLSLDIIDVAGGSWLAKTDMGDVPVDWLKVICNDCNEELCKPENGTCVRDDNRGSTLNKCVCRENLGQNESRPVGLNCDLMAACDLLAPDLRTTDLLPAIPGASFLKYTEFARLRFYFDQVEDENSTMMHHRPIYAALGEGENETYPFSFSSFMMFTGRRWTIFAAPAESRQFIDVEEFVGFLRDNDVANKPVQTLKNISQSYSSFEPIFFTMPVNYGGESYHRETGIPWVQTEKLDNYKVISHRADDSQQLPVRYLCSDCVSSG